MDTVLDLIALHAEKSPDQPAILGADGTLLTYRTLQEKTSRIAATLHALGIGPNDKIAVIMPDGVPMAVTFLAVASAATFVPLNPQQPPSELGSLLEAMAAKAIILHDLTPPSVVAFSEAQDLPVWRMGSELALEGFQQTHQQATTPSAPKPNDVALILHTSGTTSRPKMVPLTNRNLSRSAGNIVATLDLSAGDRCLGIMPLFHIHGLIGGLLSTVSSGGSIVCMPPFKPDGFLDSAHRFEVTWYTAVPTMHQAILAEAQKSEDPLPSFRFIRSSSAALPTTVISEMESCWKTPIIESYGMTEASHQMTSNPLPPLPRKPGSVGIAAGPEVAIMSSAEDILERGTTGEVVIRGSNVTPGYANNPEANQSAFSKGWFRTGDQGYLDEDGYLFLTGRLKKMINRGGENISPREVDEALMEHEGVEQAVAFAIPHPTLGEDLAVAVVLRQGSTVTASSLRGFVNERLAAFKVPNRILFLEAIPKGPTGKLQRIGLSKTLAAQLEIDYLPPETKEEKLVAATFSEVLGREMVGKRDNFLSLGGDSLRATQVLARLRSTTQRELPVSTLFRFPTPELLAQEISRHDEADIDELADELATLSSEEIDRLLTESLNETPKS